MFRRNRLAASSVILALIIITGCSGRSASPAPPPEANVADTSAAVIAVVTFDALCEIAAVIGGDRVSAANIMPPGAEAHHFEPGARDLILLNTADLLIVCGLGFEPWADSAVKAAANGGLSVCDVSNDIEPIVLSDDESDEHVRHSAGNENHTGTFDPHIWLSPVCAAVMSRNIMNAFIGADPAGEEYYRRNFDDFSHRLDGLAKEYSEKFGATGNKTIVTGHAVFAYLCRDFGLTQNSVEGVFAEGEPSARALAELIDFCLEHGITTIFAESLSSPLVAETLAAEAGASVEIIYTMESAEDGLSYLDRMEHNLEVIYKSLQ